MSVEAHLAELVRRHHLLEKEIEDQTTHGNDDLKLSELKRKKLVIRDKIEKLKQDSEPETVH